MGHHPLLKAKAFGGGFFVFMREFKHLPYFAVKAPSDGGRVRKGICAVFGNVDSYGDRIMPGAFTKTITEGKNRVKHLWNHDFSAPPTAVVTELREVTREELPPEVLDFAPDATGGLLVSREYLPTAAGDEILAGVDSGAITEMSFGYDVISYEMVSEGDLTIRNLKEVRLYDTSDVLWGANEATVAMGAKNSLPLGVMAQNIIAIAAEVKAGRRNASSDLALINAIHNATLDLGCTECPSVMEAKSDGEQPEETTTEETSSDQAKADAALTGASLEDRALELLSIELETLD